jgi:murein DD-endopeptidase MepM/ murein hydrolase activator NlpD
VLKKMNSQRNNHSKVADFFIRKGFYIILFLCVVAIGISGYVMITAGRAPAEPYEPVSVPPMPTVAPVETPPPPIPTIRPTMRPIIDAEPYEPAVPVLAPEPYEPADDEQNIYDEPAAAQPPAPLPTPTPAPVFVWPLAGEVLRIFSLDELQFNPTMGDWRVHGGIDIKGELGAHVVSVTDGTVVDIYDDPGMGTTVVIASAGDLRFVYQNLMRQPAVAIGDTVRAGEAVGRVGDTALFETGFGWHLHLEAWRGGQRIDPLSLLPAAT